MITLQLPIPPSVNSIWRPVWNKKTGKPDFAKRERYATWQMSALSYFLEQSAHRLPKITGHFRARVVLDERKRGLSDVDNRHKALLDFLQRPDPKKRFDGLISSDRYCDGLTVEWGEAPLGCTITLIPAGAEA